MILQTKKSAGFTLIELLVVIAIIGLLASIIMVNLNSARTKAHTNGALSFESTQLNALGANMIGEWKLNGDAKDSSGYANHGVLINAPVAQTSANCVHEGCYQFDSLSCQYIKMNLPTKLDYPFTISAWFKTGGKVQADACLAGGALGADDNNDQVIISIADTGSGNNYAGLYIGSEKNWDGSNSVDNESFETEPKSIILRSRLGTTQHNSWGSTIVTDGKWHHVAGVWNVDTSGGLGDRQIYIDGALQLFGRSDTHAVPFPPVSALEWNIGRWADQTPKSYFKGMIDDVRVFDDVMNQVAIESIYREGLKTHPVALSK